ncbi:MAG TPA: TIGR03086 family metal-binding protein [Acidimicrobiales bacterium]
MIDLTPATQRLADLVTNVDDGQLTAPTPCPDFAVGDLLDHLSTFAVAFRAAADKTVPADAGRPPPASAANLGEDWRDRIPRELAEMAEAWARPEAWEGMTRIGGMDTPAESAGVVALEEPVVHGWDLARATGQAFTVPEAELEVVSGFFGSFPDEARGEAFGLPEAVSDGATGLDRAVAQAGRNPAWSATP